MPSTMLPKDLLVHLEKNDGSRVKEMLVDSIDSNATENRISVSQNAFFANALHYHDEAFARSLFR